MKVHIYANCWNELRILPYFMRHYDPFVDKFIILDDGSTDGSIQFLEDQAKVRLIKANRQDLSYIEQSHMFFNEAWKESRSMADWIITCNIDEHVYHKDMGCYLQCCLQKGITILPAQGYEMVSLEFPSSQGRLCDQVRLGAQTERLTGPSGMLSKIMAFNPQAIEEIHFNMGRHTAKPTGRVVYPHSVELKLLHYKFLGLNYALQRYAELKTGLMSTDMKEGRGGQYTWDTSKIQRNYEMIISAARIVIPAGLIPDASLNISTFHLKIKLRLLNFIAQNPLRRAAWLMRFHFNNIKKAIFCVCRNR